MKYRAVPKGGAWVHPHPLFGPQTSKGKKIPKCMLQFFENVEFCGKKGKKNKKNGKKRRKKVRILFAPPFRKAGYGPEILWLMTGDKNLCFGILIF